MLMVFVLLSYCVAFSREIPFRGCAGSDSKDIKHLVCLVRVRYQDVAVAQKDVPKWHLGKRNQRLEPA